MIRVVNMQDEPIRIPRVLHTYEQARRLFLFALFSQTLMAKWIPTWQLVALMQGVHELGEEVLFLYQIEHGKAAAA